jgi:hypothetical protein
MTDERGLLREFRAEIPAPDDETRRRIYARATSETGRFTGGRTPGWAGPSLSRASLRLTAAVAGAAVCAALAALAATGTFSSSPKHATALSRGTSVNSHAFASQGGAPSGDAMSVGFNRSSGASSSVGSGALSSIDLTVNPSMANATIEIEVLYSSASTAADVTAANSQVVYQEQVPTTSPGSGVNGLSTWSGTLSPSDWSGGCESGIYNILAVSVGPGTSLADATYKNSDRYYSGMFSCTGS